ncbi:hypothetical protein [Microcoleus sp. herbarium12]
MKPGLYTVNLARHQILVKIRCLLESIDYSDGARADLPEIINLKPAPL